MAMASKDIHKNIEVKAKIKPDDYKRIVSEVENLCHSHGELIQQEDIFFHVPNGHLKLRKRSDYSVYELIYYERPDSEDPKLAVYSKCNVPHGQDLANVLGMSLGVRGSIKKTRHLYIHEHIRIHIDNVENLGKFFELEVVLNKDQSPDDGQKIAKDITDLLQIGEDDLISEAYVDLLHKSTDV